LLYRRIDDEYLDPEAFRPDSLLGVPGLMRAYRAGNVALANAAGAGVADDKSVYPYVPAMVRFYLDEEPILANVPIYECVRLEDLAFVLANLDKLVMKPARGSGGYGMLVGRHATPAEREEFVERITARPADYIAQPTLALSTVLAVAHGGITPRHVDLRPSILSGREIPVVPGASPALRCARGRSW
jgi:uncharacterized circularly permuted ATP-grasp superfamily protein